MEFEWDEAKRAANLAKHGIDFPIATSLFDGRPVLTLPSRRGDEQRYLTLGAIRRHVVAVVWTQRGAICRLISARRASDAEEKAYRSIHG